MSPYRMIAGFVAILSVLGIAISSELRWLVAIFFGAVNGVVWLWPRYNKWQKSRGRLRAEGQRQLAAGNYAEAETSLIDAAQQLALRRPVPVAEHAAVLCEIATAQLKLKKLAEAETSIRAILAQFTGPVRGQALMLQSELFTAQGNHTEALRAMRESLAAEQERKESDPAEIAHRTLAVARAAHSIGAPDTVQLFKDASRLHEAAFGAANESTAEALAQYGRELLHNGDAAAALPVLQRAQSVFTAADAANSRNSISALHDLAKAYSATGQPYEAIDAFELTLSRISLVAGMPEAEVAMARLDAGRAFLAAARYGPALEAIAQALAYFDHVKHPLLPSCLELSGTVLEKFSRYSEAEAAFARAIEIWEREGALDNPQAKLAIQKHAAMVRYRRECEAALAAAAAAAAAELAEHANERSATA